MTATASAFAVSATTLSRARFAVSAIFLINGLLAATWVSRIPALKRGLGLSDSEFGLSILMMAVGALGAFPATAWLVARIGSRPTTIWATLLSLLALPLLALAPNGSGFALALWLFGAAMAAMDVAMNAQAVVVERLFQRSIMAAFHGLWSAGALIGAGCGTVAAGLGASPTLHFAIATGVMAVVWVFSRSSLWSEPPAPQQSAVFEWPRGPVLGLGLLAFCGSLIEGGIADWSGIYLHESLGAAESVAALAFTLYSAAMTVGRLTGDRLIDRFGGMAMMRFGGATAALLVTIMLVTSQPQVAIVCMVLCGFGIATVFPLTFSAAGRLPFAGGTALPAVATFGYSGGLIGPPIIGFVAEATRLRIALGLIVLAALAILLLAPQLRRTPAAGSLASA